MRSTAAYAGGANAELVLYSPLTESEYESAIAALAEIGAVERTEYTDDNAVGVARQFADEIATEALEGFDVEWSLLVASPAVVGDGGTELGSTSRTTYIPMLAELRGMDVTWMLPPHPDRRWTIAKQLGLSTAVVRFWGEEEWWTYDSLLKTRNRFADHGLSLDVVEDRPPMTDTVLGREGRDEEIATVKRLLRNMGRADIDVYSWVWTENPVGVIRTSDAVPLRGESRTTAYEHEQSERAPDHPVDIGESELWENLEYFLDEVVPVAEEAGVKLALHPDDPPVSSVRGVPRLVNSVENVRRILDLHDSPNHGLTFCQGNFSAMGADVPEAIHRFGDRIHFVHFRDVEGEAESFTETWHEEGQTDMLAAMEAYRDAGFDGPIRPDHVPKMLGEQDREGTQAGYTDMGRLFAVGYMKGLLERTEGR